MALRQRKAVLPRCGGYATSSLENHRCLIRRMNCRSSEGIGSGQGMSTMNTTMNHRLVGAYGLGVVGRKITRTSRKQPTGEKHRSGRNNKKACRSHRGLGSAEVLAAEEAVHNWCQEAIVGLLKIRAFVVGDLIHISGVISVSISVIIVTKSTKRSPIGSRRCRRTIRRR